jgi:LPXTG-site transpeptidase (sortase) family protein
LETVDAVRISAKAGWVLIVAAPVVAGIMLVTDRGTATSTEPSTQPTDSGAIAFETPTTAPTQPSYTEGKHKGRLPTRLLVPVLDIDATVLPIQVTGGELVPPSDPQEVGWWSEGARTGASVGSAVLTAHTVHTGGGVFDDLKDLMKGDRVTVVSHAKKLRYVVTSVRYLDKQRLADQAAKLFDPTGPARLVLVTCDQWDGAEFNGNTIVTAKLAP